jgi:hypothetical protein
MSKSNSNLLNYISLLLNDDDALNQFLVDPIQAEEAHGITKAERAVLRRTVAHLSNKSKNGYTVNRHLGSYRRSLRLLQNVLHNVGSKMVQDASIPKENTNDKTSVGFYTMILYFPFESQENEVNLTCQNNEYVKSNYGDPYSHSSITFHALISGPVTAKDVMDNIKSRYLSIFDYATVNMKDLKGNTYEYVSYIKYNLNGSNYEGYADISNNCYNLKENPGADFVFWFYSVNGKANPHTSGEIAQSFSTKHLNPCDTLYWQLIAPDKTYGFYPCDSTPGNKHPNS